MEQLIQPLLYVVSVPVWYIITMLVIVSVMIIALVRMWGRRGLEISVLEYELKKQTEKTKDVIKQSQNQIRLIDKKEGLLQIAQEELRKYRQSPMSLSTVEEVEKQTVRIGKKTPNSQPSEKRKLRASGQ